MERLQVSEWAFVPLRDIRDSILASDILEGIYVPSFEYAYEIVTALIVVGVFLALRVFSKVAAPVVYAFPMPRRPLEPVLRWIPPEHKVDAVKAYIAAPKRKGRPWNGNWQRIIKRLPSRLQAVLEPQSAPVGLQASTVAVARPALQTSPQSASQATVARTAKTAPPARPSTASAAWRCSKRISNLKPRDLGCSAMRSYHLYRTNSEHYWRNTRLFIVCSSRPVLDLLRCVVRHGGAG